MYRRSPASVDDRTEKDLICGSLPAVAAAAAAAAAEPLVSAAWSAVGDVLLPYLLRLRHTSALWSAASRRAGRGKASERTAKWLGESGTAPPPHMLLHARTHPAQRGGPISGAWREERRGRWGVRLHNLLLRAATRRHGQQRAASSTSARGLCGPLTSSIWRLAMAFAALASRSCASTPAAAAATFAFCAARRQPARQPSSSNGKLQCFSRARGAELTSSISRTAFLRCMSTRHGEIVACVLTPNRFSCAGER